MDSGLSVHSIYLDLRKAFDKVPHVELLSKIKHQFQIEGNLLAWLESFLTSRRQRVTVGRKYSEWAEVTSGVPQGSVLAPLLFIMYVSDMQVDSNNSLLVKFADDTKIYSAITDDTCPHLLQNSLDTLVAWCENWKMPINISKSGILQFERRKHNERAYFIKGEPLKHL